MKTSASKNVSNRVIGIKKADAGQPKLTVGLKINNTNSVPAANMRRNNSSPQQRNLLSPGIVGLEEEISAQSLDIKAFPTQLSSISKKEDNDQPSQSGLSSIIGQSPLKQKRVTENKLGDAKLNDDLSNRIEECIVSSQNILESTLALLSERNHPLKERLLWIRNQNNQSSQKQATWNQKSGEKLSDRVTNKEREFKQLTSQSSDVKIPTAAGSSSISRNTQPTPMDTKSYSNQNFQKTTKASNLSKTNYEYPKKTSSPPRRENIAKQLSPENGKAEKIQKASSKLANQRLNIAKDEHENANSYNPERVHGIRVSNTDHSNNAQEDSNLQSKSINVLPASYDRVFNDEDQILEAQKFQFNGLHQRGQPPHSLEKPKQSQQSPQYEATDEQFAYAGLQGKSQLGSSEEPKTVWQSPRSKGTFQQSEDTHSSKKHSISQSISQDNDWLNKMESDVKRRNFDKMQREKLKEEIEKAKFQDPHKNKRMSPEKQTEHVNRMWNDATRRHLASQHIQQVKLEEEALQANTVFNSSPNKTTKSKVKEYIETPTRMSQQEEPSNQEDQSQLNKSWKKSENNRAYSNKQSKNSIEKTENASESPHLNKLRGILHGATNKGLDRADKEQESKSHPAHSRANYYSPFMNATMDELQPLAVQNSQKNKTLSSPKQYSNVQSKVGQILNKRSPTKDSSFSNSGVDRKVQSYMDNLLAGFRHKEMFYK